MFFDIIPVRAEKQDTRMLIAHLEKILDCHNPGSLCNTWCQFHLLFITRQKMIRAVIKPKEKSSLDGNKRFNSRITISEMVNKGC